MGLDDQMLQELYAFKVYLVTTVDSISYINHMKIQDKYIWIMYEYRTHIIDFKQYVVHQAEDHYHYHVAP